jgi:hypothetical protein
MQTYYNVFTRTWWRMEDGKRVPGAGRKTYLGRHLIFEDARTIAKQYNETHEPGPLSRKAEIEEA